MDWAKAKSILIFVFIILNIFLFVNLNIYNSGSDTGKNIANTEKILKSRGYILECNIPKTTAKSVMIDYQRIQIDKKRVLDKLLGHLDILPDVINSTFEFIKGSKKISFDAYNDFRFEDVPNGKLDISNKKKTGLYVRKYLKNLGLGVKDFYLDGYYVNQDKSVTYEFLEKQKDYLIYCSYATVMVTDRGIKMVECALIKVNSLTYTNTKITPAYLILLKNFTRGKNTVIKSIDLGLRGLYLGEKTQFSENIVWRVKLADGTKRHFSIIDGQPID